MLICKSKLDMRMCCVHILYKLFQIVTKNKSDKNIINIPPENVTTKILWTIRKLLLSKMTKKILWLKWVLVGTSWQHYLIGSDTRNQIWKPIYRKQIWEVLWDLIWQDCDYLIWLKSLLEKGCLYNFQ